MNCLKCGTLNAENAVFCKNCGTSLFKQEQEQTENNSAINNETEQPTDNEQRNEEQQTEYVHINPVVALIKKWASSKLFLIATILFTVSLGLSVLSGFLNSMLQFGENGMSFSSGVMSVSVTGIIAMIGLWKISTMGKKAELDLSGVKLLKVVCILELVITCVVCGLCGLLLVLVGIFLPQIIDIAGDSWNEIMLEAREAFEQGMGNVEGFSFEQIFNPQTFAIIFIVLGVVLLGAVVFSIIFYSHAIKNVGIIKDIAQSERLNKNVSMGFIVLMFVVGALNASSLLTGGFAMGCQGAAYILYGIVLNNFRNEAEKLQYVVNCNEL